MASKELGSGGQDRGAVPGAPRQAAALEGIVESFGFAALRIVLAVVAAFALMDLLIVVVDGDDVGRVAVGIVSTLAGIASLRWFEITARFLRRPGAVAAVVGVISVGVAGTGTWNSPYTSEVFALMGVATVVASTRGVVVSVVVAALGYVGGLLLEGITPAQLVDTAHAAVVANTIGDFVLFAVVLLVALRACRQVLGPARQTLESVRAGGPAMTQQLGLALRRADRAPVAWLPPARAADLVAMLSARERALVLRLAAGLLPKQVALETGTPMGTIRSGIASAKRKTGARTVEQLVALVTESERAV